MKSLSIIVPTHNNVAVIGRTLQSVEDSIAFFRAQDDALKTVPVEIVLVDDGSSDATPEMLRDWAGSRSFCKLVLRRQAGGAACARNTGAAQSTGDLLYFLDGDDLFYPPHLHACYVVSEEGKYYVKTAMHLADPVHAEWQRAIEGSSVINLCLAREYHFSLGGFPDLHLFRRDKDEFRPLLDIYHHVEDQYYNLLLRNVFPGRKVRAETVEYVRYPGNAYDRQYEKFRRPRAENPETLSRERVFQLELCNLLHWYRLGQLRPDQGGPPSIVKRRKESGDIM